MSDLRGLIERDYARAYGQALIAQADREPRRVYLGEGIWWTPSDGWWRRRVLLPRLFRPRRPAEHHGRRGALKARVTETWRYPDGSIKRVRPPFYPASCNSCGWQGSSEKCGLDTGGDDSDVYCPVCGHPGCDHGVAAEKAGEWDEGPLPASSGATEPTYRQVICGECEGSGLVVGQCEIRTLDDLDNEAMEQVEGKS